jgi:transposase
MWKPFRNSTAQHAPQAAILFDKFHIIRHLGDALDKVRKLEYARLGGQDRTFIKGLWDYSSEAWARKFFENWRAQLKWQRLKPYEQFAALIERQWAGIAAYCKPENKVALGFVEGLNNKIRVIQRRAYGLHDEQYLKLKVLTCTLPAI